MKLDKTNKLHLNIKKKLIWFFKIKPYFLLIILIVFILSKLTVWGQGNSHVDWF